MLSVSGAGNHEAVSLIVPEGVQAVGLMAALILRERDLLSFLRRLAI